MATNNIVTVGVNVTDNGTTAKATNEAKKLEKGYLAAGKAASNIKVAGDTQAVQKAKVLASRSVGSPEDTPGLRRGATGVGGGSDAKDFSRQAQGLGGLVHIYATFAANIFAVSAAFTALSKAMDFEIMTKGAKLLEAESGIALRSTARSMKELTDNAISAKEALRLTNLASSAGITRTQIEALTKGAKGASVALGRDMADSIDRVIRGVSKLEPELLDELGVTVKASQAYREFGRTIGKTADELTGYQKTMAYANAVQEELLRKFSSAAEGEINPYTKLLATATDAAIELANVLNKVLIPIVKVLADNLGLVAVGILLIVKNLLGKAIPEIGKMFMMDPAVVASNKAKYDKIESDIKAAQAREVALGEQHKATKIAKLQQEYAQISAIVNAGEQHKLETVQAYAEKSKDKSIRKAGRKATHIDDFSESDSFVDKIAKSKSATESAIQKEKLLQLQRESTLKTAIAAQDTAQVKTLQSEIVLGNQRLADLGLELNAVNKVTAALELQENKLEKINREKELVREQAVIPTTGPLSAATQRAHANANFIAVRTAETANVQNAAAIHGVGSTAHLNAETVARERVTAAAIAQAKAYGLATTAVTANTAGTTAAITSLTFLGNALVKTQIAMFNFGVFAAKWGTRLAASFGWISILAMAVFGLVEVWGWMEKKLGIVTLETEHLDKVNKDFTESIDGMTGALATYNKIQSKTIQNSADLIQKATIEANLNEEFSQTLRKQVEALEAVKKAKGEVSKGDLEESKANTIKGIDKLIQISDVPTSIRLEQEKANIRAAKSVEEYSAAESKLQPVLRKSIDLNRNYISANKELSDKFAEFGTAVDKVTKKDYIKDDDVRKTYEMAGAFKKLGDNANEAQRLATMAEIGKDMTPERLKYVAEYSTELAKVLDKMMGRATLNEEAKKLEKEIAELGRRRDPEAIAALQTKSALYAFLTGQVAEYDKVLASINLKEVGDKAQTDIQAKAKALEMQNKAYQQQRDLIKSILDLEAIKLTANKRAQTQEEKLQGYISDRLLLEEQSLQVSIANTKAQEQVEEAKKKFKDAEGAAGANKVRDATLRNIELTRKAALQSIDDTTKHNMLLQNQKKFVQDILEARKESIALSNAQLDSASKLGLLSDQEAADQKHILALQALSDQFEADVLTKGAKEVEQLLRKLHNQQDILEVTKKTADEERRRSEAIRDATSAITLQQKYNQEIVDQRKYINTLGIKQVDIATEITKKYVELAKATKTEAELQLLRLQYIEEQNAAYMIQHEQQKKLVDTFDNKTSIKQLIGDEAQLRLDTFKKGVTDVITGTFNAIYDGMDAGIDMLFDKIQKSEKIVFEDIVKVVRNTASEVFKNLAAERAKLAGREIIANITGIDTRTQEERLAGYAEESVGLLTRIANATEKTASPTSATTTGFTPYMTKEQGSVDYVSEMDKQADAAHAQKYAADKQFSTAELFSITTTKLGSDLTRVIAGEMTVAQMFKNTVSNLGPLLMSFVKGLWGAIQGLGSSSGGGLGGLLGGIGKIFGFGGGGESIAAGLPGAGNAILDAATFLAAKGGVFPGSPSLSAYSNSIVSSPTMFAFAQGGVPNRGVMGEAGPEAIIPLARDGSGNLGVRGGGSTNNVEINITIENSQAKEGKSSGGGDEQSSMAKQLGNVIKATVTEELIKQQRPGGLLAR